MTRWFLAAIFTVSMVAFAQEGAVAAPAEPTPAVVPAAEVPAAPAAVEAHHEAVAAPVEAMPEHHEAAHDAAVAHGEAPAHEGAAHHGGGHGEPHDAPSYILHHVSDSDEFELEFPWGGSLVVPVAEWFQFLKIEHVPGACSLEPSPAFASFPSLGSFIAGCWDFRPTKAILMIWLAMAILFVILALSKKWDANGVPRGLLTNTIESLVLFVRDEIAVPNIGKEEAPRYTPYLVSLFFFILATDWLGLIPGMFAGTGVVAVTAGLAIITFVMTQLAGIRAAGVGGYLAHLTGGVHPALWAIMIPVEFLGLFTKPFALLVRLFANMLGGHMVIFFLLALIFVWTPYAAVVSVPLAVAIYCLEIFVGILQAYLFTLLTSLFIGQGVAMGHHHHDAHEPAHGEGHGHAH
jgi:F-type H+-transporting ATPase subunit a